MTVLTLAIRNQLVQSDDLTDLLGKSVKWPDGWVFSEDLFVKHEGTERVAIVVSETGSWAPPNIHNSQDFPLVFVDIWADPTRNEDGSVRYDDAKDKIIAVHKEVKKILHTKSLSGADGMPIVWGTAAEAMAKTGVWINGSQQLSGPAFSDIQDNAGGVMARYTYGVNILT